MRLPWWDGPEVITVSWPSTAGGQLLYGRTCSLLAWAVAESAAVGAAAEADLIDGSGVGGDLLIPLRLAAGGFVSGSFGGAGFPFETGLFLSMAAGSTKGSVVLGIWD